MKEIIVQSVIGVGGETLKRLVMGNGALGAISTSAQFLVSM